MYYYDEYQQEEIELVPELYINDAYYPYVEEYNKRVMAFYGGAGSGKSHFVVQKMVLKALNNPNRKTLVIRKVGATLRASIYALFLDILRNDYGLSEEDGDFTARDSLLTIDLCNGSQFIFKGLDDPEKIKSIAGIDDIVIEEATELTLDDYTQLNLRLRSANPYNQIHLMFNPVSKANWVYKYFFQTELGEDTFVLKTTWKDNKCLPQGYIDSLEKMKETNYTYYKIYAEGEFATLDKLIYSNWKKDREVTRESIMAEYRSKGMLRQLKPIHGLDFGYVNDPTAFIAGLVDIKEKIIYLYDEHYEPGMTNEMIANTLIYKGYQKEKLVAESAEPKSIDELKAKGLARIQPAKKGQDSLLNGIQFLHQFKIIVNPDTCPNTVTELENYTWKKDKKTNEYINTPNDSFNHILDALRYAMNLIQLPKTVKASLSAY